MTVVILAAGLGTRMRSKRAKVLHRAGGLTLVEHVAAAAATLAPSDRIIVVTGHQAEEVEAVLAPLGMVSCGRPGRKARGTRWLACRDALTESGWAADGAVRRHSSAFASNSYRSCAISQSASGAAATLITTTLDDPIGYGRVILNGRAT